MSKENEETDLHRNAAADRMLLYFVSMLHLDVEHPQPQSCYTKAEVVEVSRKNEALKFNGNN